MSTRIARVVPMLAFLTAACLMVFLTAACNDTPTNPSARLATDEALGSVKVAPEALVLAAGGTQQLAVTAFALDGTTTLASNDTIRYVSSDSSRVRVSNTGLITASTGPKAVTAAPVRVVASVVHGGVTRADTSYVAVVATAGTSPTFSMHDPTSATTKIPLNTTKTVVTTITYFDGTSTVTMSSGAIPVHIRVLNSTVVVPTSATQFYTYASSGTVTIEGTTNVFGTTFTDTVTYTLGYAQYGFIRIYTSGLLIEQGLATSNQSFPVTSAFYIQVGGYMSVQNWVNMGTYTAGVTCTATSGGPAPAPVTGMASNFGSGTIVFPNAGTYGCDWTSNGFPNFPTDGSLHFSVVVQ